jgi:hypothetical protein
MTVQPFLIGEGWQEIRDGDPSLIAMHRRHYSYEPPAEGRRKQALAIGPGFKLALMTADGGAICAWRKEKHRKDGQAGVNCSIYRREVGEPSSALLSTAMDLAWAKWPGERLFTFVDPRQVKPTMVKGPRGHFYAVWGYCFYQAGWLFEGLTAKGLHILAAYPEGGDA